MFLTAFGLTVIVDLTVAVETGIALAALLFIKQVAETTQITAVDETTETEGSHHSLIGKEIPKGVMVYRIFGSFFFGAVDKLENALERLHQEPEVLILRMRKVLSMDATGLNALEEFARAASQARETSSAQRAACAAQHICSMMDRAGFLDPVGAGQCLREH